MEEVVCDVDRRLDHGKHESDLEKRTEGRIAGRTVGVIHRPVSHPDGADDRINRKHPKARPVRITGKSHGMQERRMNGKHSQTADERHRLAQVDNPVCSAECLLVIARTDLFADKYGRCRREAGEESNDQPFERPEYSSRRNGTVRLMPEDNVDHHVSDTDQNFIEDDRIALGQKFPDQSAAFSKMPANLQKERYMAGFC